MNKPIICVFAVDEEWGFAKDGEIPWEVPEDQAFFQRQTTRTFDPEKENALVMGRRTWESLPASVRPLKRRLNVVLSRDPNFKPEGAIVFPSFPEAITYLQSIDLIESIMVIGGEDLLREAFTHKDCRLIVMSSISGIHKCDQFLRPPDEFKLLTLSPIPPFIVFWFGRE